jgi:hypothetical protein
MTIRAWHPLPLTLPLSRKGRGNAGCTIYFLPGAGEGGERSEPGGGATA